MSDYCKQNPESIQHMFGSIAHRYDRANAILSLQLHKLWNSKLIDLIEKKKPETLLDLCCGTGDVALKFLERQNLPSKAILLDFCPEMLSCAKAKASKQAFSKHSISYLTADAQAIPLEDECTQSVTLAYGIRNIKDPEKSFREIYRVLQPNGILAILELTRPTNPFIRIGHKIYLRTLLPLLGKLITANQDAYRYLCESINNFVSPSTLEMLLRKNGFTNISIKPLAGGIATIITAEKCKEEG